MKIQITREDIDKGKMCNSYDCPGAVAIQRALNTKKVSVRERYVTVFESASYQIPTPPVLREFIDAFDASEIVKPIEFELDFQGLVP